MGWETGTLIYFCVAADLLNCLTNGFQRPVVSSEEFALAVAGSGWKLELLRDAMLSE